MELLRTWPNRPDDVLLLAGALLSLGPMVRSCRLFNMVGFFNVFFLQDLLVYPNTHIQWPLSGVIPANLPA